MNKAIIKAIRFTSKELDIINKFIEINPAFNISSLVRAAIIQFISNPKFNKLDKR